MLTELKDMQFEILDSEDASSGVAFGIGRNVSIDDEGFDPGDNAWVTQDSVNPIQGYTMFGRDVNAGRTWGFQMHTDKDDEHEALAALAEIATAWRGREYATTPGAVTALRYRLAGRTRRVYGRPRRFAAPPTNLIMSGLVPITADFSVVDDLHYDDELSSAQLSWSQDSDGGFVLPTTLPIQTIPGSNRAGLVTVLGDAPTYAVIRFEGPITDPYVTNGDWTVSLDMSISEGDYVEVDTRPWKMTALRNGRASVAGKLGRRQWLTDVRLKPGNQELRFGGATSSGGATCTVSWRSAWNSL